MEEKDVKIFNENFSSFSEMDACSALGAGLIRGIKIDRATHTISEKRGCN
ncbi:hypothetical protein [Aerococcus sp. Group 1]|nr:hypothetical protein [Aerococcus sp. Group 1]MCY3061936.1 hypothetical protein [Aerococcus sp. Group 1]